MSKKYSRYFATLFVARWMSTTIAFVALLSVVDSVTNADKIPEGAGVVGAFQYVFLRLPALFDRIFMIALLVSLLVTYITLLRRNELVSFLAMGISPIMQVKALAIPAVVLSLISAIVIDQTLPRSNVVLDNWLGVGALSDDFVGNESGIWIAEPQYFIEIGTVKDNALYDLRIYKRGEGNAIEAVTSSPSAKFASPNWVLEQPRSILSDGNPYPTEMIWETNLTPQLIHKISTSPRNLNLFGQFQMANLKGIGTAPASAYWVWAMNRITMPIVAVVLVIVAVPLMHQMGRNHSGDQRLMIGGAIGFGFFILDGALKTIAESGGISVTAAICFPVLLLLAVGVYLHLDLEDVS